MYKYLLLTMLIEIPIYFLFVREKIAYSILILVLANCFTWPILNILFHNTHIHLLFLETGVTVVEAFIICFFFRTKIFKSVANFIHTKCSYYFYWCLDQSYKIVKIKLE